MKNIFVLFFAIAFCNLCHSQKKERSFKLENATVKSAINVIGIKSDSIPIAKLKESSGLISYTRYSDDSFQDQDVQSQVENFDVLIISEPNKIFKESIRGYNFSSLLIDNLKKLKTGDVLVFYNIKVKILGEHIKKSAPCVIQVID